MFQGGVRRECGRRGRFGGLIGVVLKTQVEAR